MQIRIAAAGMPLFGTYERAVFFLLVLRQQIGEDSQAKRRPISILAIATSVHRPYATVWRQIQAMTRDGLLGVAARSVNVPDSALARPEVVAFITRVTEACRALIEQLARESAPPLPDVALLTDERMLASGIDLLLCTVESPCGVDWTDLLLMGYIQSWAGETNGPNHDRDTMPNVSDLTLRRLAHDISMPYSTVHRRTRTMAANGLLERRGRNLIIADEWLAGSDGTLRTMASVECAGRVLKRLANL